MSTTDKKNFDQLRAKMSPESRARSDAKAAKYAAEMEAEQQIASLQSELAATSRKLVEAESELERARQRLALLREQRLID